MFRLFSSLDPFSEEILFTPQNFQYIATSITADYNRLGFITMMNRDVINASPFREIFMRTLLEALIDMVRLDAVMPVASFDIHCTQAPAA